MKMDRAMKEALAEVNRQVPERPKPKVLGDALDQIVEVNRAYWDELTSGDTIGRWRICHVLECRRLITLRNLLDVIDPDPLRCKPPKSWASLNTPRVTGARKRRTGKKVRQ
jgi:hypothetical protein